ncbi:hypothetical protein FHL15_003718 [Xylaria flabelliformis]|uniref:Uncharacterized protein n=1 Tax=Xylaria flabelliformis TaxID=2512241 RepID=A0A553I5B2_9PEZI|nr:hypothetical protein FHL15_003718 [Xylaria flabelliformis]
MAEMIVGVKLDLSTMPHINVVKYTANCTASSQFKVNNLNRRQHDRLLRLGADELRSGSVCETVARQQIGRQRGYLTSYGASSPLGNIDYWLSMPILDNAMSLNFILAAFYGSIGIRTSVLNKPLELPWNRNRARQVGGRTTNSNRLITAANPVAVDAKDRYRIPHLNELEDPL